MNQADVEYTKLTHVRKLGITCAHQMGASREDIILLLKHTVHKVDTSNMPELPYQPTPILTQLVRLMTVLCTGSFMFTSSMIMNVCYGIMTGIGTIDRLKKKATSTMMESDEEPIELVDIFGIGPYYTWLLPMDPIFEDFDRVMGYSTPQRLLREQLRVENPYYNINHKSIELSNSNNSNIHHFLV